MSRGPTAKPRRAGWGVIFLTNVDSADEAKAELYALPLVTRGFVQYEFIPVGPLSPLGRLIHGK
jgi:hypothetical protein